MKRTLLSCAILALTAAAAELPVRQVILYKHGVGYFERSGQLGPGESARLDFKATEMNDVLKSLTVEEKGGGKISGLRYDSSEPLAVKLGEFPFQLEPGAPLSKVLDQLKGARVEMKFGNESVSGAIVSGRLVAGDDKRPEREQLTLLLDDGELRTFDLSAATSMRFSDPKLQSQFKDYLAALTAARSKEKRSVYIDSTDAKGREVIAGYMIPTPIWKSTYRLIFGEAAQPVLEGWAIVDNTTGEDWTKVQLSLVSGRPVSFISQLYEPRYIARQAAELPEDAAARPVIYEGAVEQLKETERAAGVGGAYVPGRREAAGRMQSLNAPMPAPPAAKAMMPSTVVANTDARELGDLFEYRITTPVTVKKSESAMLPFLQQKIDARKLLIYSDGASVHPMNAAEITNATGKTLDGGPITVYDANAYAGEALMETLKQSDKRLISYAVDLGTRVTTAFDTKAEVVREIHFNRGVLTSRVAVKEIKTYTIKNVDQKAKTLIIEHPVRPGYTLLDRKPSEKTPRAYRFEVKLGAGATETFPVAEERVYDQTTEVSNLTPDVLLTYVRNKSLSDAARKQLEQIATQKREIAGMQGEIQRTDAGINELVQDQERIRRNISSLNQVSGQQQQVQTYAKQLAMQESQLATLRDRSAELKRKKAAAESALNALIESVSF
jgi:uncharacterized lipoprotein YehR (DUF1307 family)